MSLLSIYTLFLEQIKANIMNIGTMMQVIILQTSTKLEVCILFVHKKNAYETNSITITMKVHREHAPTISEDDNS
jgi:hypothetical protein